METVQTIRKTDLARQTRKVIRKAQRGVTIVVENHGEPEVAIVDILDYRILRALTRFYVEPTAMETGALLAIDVNGELEPDEKVEVVVHDAPGEDLDAGESGLLAEKLREDILLEGSEEHVATGRATHDVIEPCPVWSGQEASGSHGNEGDTGRSGSASAKHYNVSDTL